MIFLSGEWESREEALQGLRRIDFHCEAAWGIRAASSLVLGERREEIDAIQCIERAEH